MIVQMLYDYIVFQNTLKQWEFEYLRDNEVRKHKALNEDGVNENEIYKEIN